MNSAARFLEFVDKTGECWTWKGCRDNKNYGQVRWGGKIQLAHRVSWEIHNGPIPKGMNALHRCDNPPCVRPDHLFLGTLSDNTRDCIAKGRFGEARVRGETHHQAKLTDSDVVAIRDLRQQGLSCAEISRRIKIVTKSTIERVCNGANWKHLPVSLDTRERTGE